MEYVQHQRKGNIAPFTIHGMHFCTDLLNLCLSLAAAASLALHIRAGKRILAWQGLKPQQRSAMYHTLAVVELRRSRNVHANRHSRQETIRIVVRPQCGSE